jgi:hypothetical protein
METWDALRESIDNRSLPSTERILVDFDHRDLVWPIPLIERTRATTDSLVAEFSSVDADCG